MGSSKRAARRRRGTLAGVKKSAKWFARHMRAGAGGYCMTSTLPVTFDGLTLAKLKEVVELFPPPRPESVIVTPSEEALFAAIESQTGRPVERCRPGELSDGFLGIPVHVVPGLSGPKLIPAANLDAARKLGAARLPATEPPK